MRPTCLIAPLSRRLVRVWCVCWRGRYRGPTVRSGASSCWERRNAQRILRDWNATSRAVPTTTLPELFAAQASRTPDAAAVEYEGATLSYGALDAASNRVAHHLRGLGVGPEVVVGLCVERSLDMVIGLLGILKAGGAYLPLDPEYPADRLSFMLRDARVPVLVTQSRLLQRLPADLASGPAQNGSQHTTRAPQIVCLDRDAAAIARAPASAPASGLHPQHPAYVIYTSGSTGTPKGVVVTHHGGIPNLCGGADRRVRDSDRTMGAHPAFASCVRCVGLGDCGALLYGAIGCRAFVIATRPTSGMLLSRLASLF